MDVLGSNIVAEFFGCPPEILDDVSLIETRMLEAAEAAHATVINSTFHHFSPFGVSGVVVIQESHIAIHTWPEYGYAALDIFTCGKEIDPWACYRHLLDSLKVQHGSAMEQGRGLRSLLEHHPLPDVLRVTRDGPPALPPRMRNVWFTERDQAIALSLRHRGDPLHRARSPHQKIEVYDTYAYGRMLALDGRVMTTEGDEYVYHEMMAHVPLLTHPAPRDVLVVGGGDGGLAREILRHEAVARVELVEIDAEVVEVSRRFLPGVASAFDDPRLALRIGDGAEFLAQCPPGTFDVVCVDVPDPLGPAKRLFSPGFYEDASRALRPGGVLVTQCESPRFNVKVFQEMHALLREIFGPARVHPYLIAVPSYPSGTWGLSYCTLGDAHPVRDLDPQRAAHFAEQHRLRYYNDAMHAAAFALPGYVKQLLAGAPA